MTAAIYARYSSDLQNERSIEDQIALCRTFAGREGLAISAIYEDRARSGTSMHGRDGLARLMDAARAGAFKVVIVEALDRIARDQEDLPHIWKRLTFAGVEIRCVHDGRADAVKIGVRGMVGALYSQDLAHKIRRANAGRAREGKHPSGVAYGYRRPVGHPGEREIVETEAAVVRRVFAAYLGGASPRDIATTLNRERIPSPRGRTWNASTINGSRARQNGILHNELYAGVLIWNRLRMVKDPDTGRRVSRANPEQDWIRTEVPDLAIVDRATFDAAQARNAGRARFTLKDGRRPPGLLSGLLKCGGCGAGMVSRGRDKTGKSRLECSGAKERGNCDHRRIYYAGQIEAVVLGALEDELRDPAVVAAALDAYAQERRRLAAGMERERGERTRRLGEVTRTLERLVDAIGDGSATMKTIGGRMTELEAERARLEADIAAADAGPDKTAIALHPAAANRYLKLIADLGQSFAAGRATGASGLPGGITSSEALRELLDRVIIHPTAPRAPIDVEIRGRLAALMQAPALAPNRRVMGGAVVAADGFEPPTKGL